MRRDGTLLKRYCAGEFDQVWREIRSHVSIEGEFRNAQAIHLSAC
jgi:hypothetical protein